MKKILPIAFVVGGLLLATAVWSGYQNAERAKQKTDALRELVVSKTSPVETQAISEENSELTYDPTDLDQTPIGIVPFIPTMACYADWGNHLRQYCEGGDNTLLELIEGGSDQTESMRVFSLCLNGLLHRMDAYKTDYRPMDSKVEQNEANRKNLACKLTTAYGNNSAFNNGSIYYIVKEHMESGNIDRLSK